MTEHFDWQSEAETNCGAVRKVNEDSILSLSDAGLWVVADGMGGHEAGDVASDMLVTSLSHIASSEKLSVMVDRVEDMIQQVHQDIRNHSLTAFGGRTMGCTVVAMIARGDVGVCLWAGDSRLYRFRKGNLEAISKDHSHVNEMVQQGIISEEEADNHPSSNIITRAVGATVELYLDSTIFAIEEGDEFLLCSDGLYGELSKKEMSRILKGKEIKQATTELLQTALERGARDNVSIILIRAAQANR